MLLILAVISRVHRPLPYIDRSSSLDEDVLCAADTGSQDSTEGLNHINGGCGGERFSHYFLTLSFSYDV